jgi:hypothetical protein
MSSPVISIPKPSPTLLVDALLEHFGERTTISSITGGHNDTDRNTTERILLLLESVTIDKSNQAYERVVRGVINCYLEEDNHFLTGDSKRYRVPRFLLNDVVPFWRTMAVDFASKQRDRAGEEWGSRNAKLRMSKN